MPYKEDDALDSKTFEILLKRGALETLKIPSKSSRKTLKNRLSPRVRVRISRNKSRIKSRSSPKDTEKYWSNVGKNAGINAMSLINAANIHVYAHQKLNARAQQYENEMLNYLNIIGRHIRLLEKNKTNFRIEESERNRTAKKNRTEKPKYFLKKEALAPLFRNIGIRGDGNCLFNSFAWWIITYFSTTEVSFSEMDEHLLQIIPKVRGSPLNAAKNTHIEKVAKLLRCMVCGFYDKYKIVDKDLRDTDLKLVSLADLNSQIVGLDRGHDTKICKPGEWGTDVDARIMAYILKVNVVFVLTNEYQHYYSAEFGELNRPTFYIFNSTGHYEVLYPASIKLQGSIAPLPIAPLPIAPLPIAK